MFLQQTFASVGKVLPAVVAPLVIAELRADPAWVGVYYSVAAAAHCLRRWVAAALSSAAWHSASLRGVPRQPYRCRLPAGRELTFSRAGAVRLMHMVIRQFAVPTSRAQLLLRNDQLRRHGRTR